MFKSQAGQILLLTLLATGVGALSTGAMLAVVSITSRTSGTFQDASKEYYAAAAGIELSISGLLLGADGLVLDTCYPELDIGGPLTINGQEVSISITSPQTGGSAFVPKSTYRYINPGVPDAGTGGLKLLAPDTTWKVKLNGMEPY